MKTIIHVNQHHIKANNKLLRVPGHESEIKPVLTVKTYKTNDYGHTAVIRCRSTGRELGRFVYRPNDPLSCGAHVWFESEEAVEVITTPPGHSPEKRTYAGQDQVQEEAEA